MVPRRLRQHSVRLQHALPVPMFLLVLPAVALMFSSCSANPGATAAAEGPVTLTIPVSPLPASSLDAVSSTAAIPTTDAPTTVEATDLPSTELPARPTTTESTTTTTTTVPAPTTTVAPNVEIVGPAPTPIEAVGTSNGPATAVLQARLLQLGFWNSGADGDYGQTTKQAVMAFQKYLGLDTTGSVDQATANYLTEFSEKGHGVADTGTMVEVDKDRQLLFVISNGMTVLVLNTSTANGLPYEEEDKNTPGEIVTGVSLTPNGLWRVYRERAEGWWEGDLGEIYRPKYFRGGVAVHGSNSIPDYPASHGCVRVSVAAMDMIWDLNLMPKGTTVWVHGG
jgi:Putative peptidoglycan binding domain/L,D-transpeptidase catalytic domain